MMARSSSSVPSSCWYLEPMAPQSLRRVETSAFCSMIRVLRPFSANDAPTSRPPVPPPMTRASTSTVSAGSGVSGSGSSQPALTWATSRAGAASSATAVLATATAATEAAAVPATKLRRVREALIQGFLSNAVSTAAAIRRPARCPVRRCAVRANDPHSTVCAPVRDDDSWRNAVQGYNHHGLMMRAVPGALGEKTPRGE